MSLSCPAALSARLNARPASHITCGLWRVSARVDISFAYRIATMPAPHNPFKHAFANGDLAAWLLVGARRLRTSPRSALVPGSTGCWLTPNMRPMICVLSPRSCRSSPRGTATPLSARRSGRRGSSNSCWTRGRKALLIPMVETGASSARAGRCRHLSAPRRARRRLGLGAGVRLCGDWRLSDHRPQRDLPSRAGRKPEGYGRAGRHP